MRIYSQPSQTGPCRVLAFSENCIGCNSCVNVCPCDVMIPNPEKGREPIVLYAEECWFCGGCVEECPRGALTLVAPAEAAPVRRLGTQGNGGGVSGSA